MAGPEDFAMRRMLPSDVLDRRFDGYLRDSKHFAQDSIIPMKLYCNNTACTKYYQKGDASLGSCFLIKELNEDEKCEYLYFATAAHNLYCRFCKNYRWVKPILKWTAGQRQADDFLLDAENLGVSKSSFYGWMKVSDGYIQKSSQGGNSKECFSKECFPFDYGILAVKIAGIKKAKRYASTVRRMGMFAAPAERHDLKFVKRAYLCGYPGEVSTQNAEEPPQGPPANAADLEYMGPTKKADGYFQWKVQGGRFWMSRDRSNAGEEATDTKTPPSLLKAKERQTAALYPLPQRHERGTCAEQDSQLNKDRLYRHYIDTSDGQSGSPVYLCEPDDDDDDDQQCVAMGIHVGVWYGAKGQEKDMGFNVAVRLPGHVLREMESWVRDPSNKAGDQSDPLPDVDTLEGTEDYDLRCQPPTLFGSNMEQPGAGAAAQANPPKATQPRTADPWKSEEYLHSYETLLFKMVPEKVKNKCKKLGVLDGYFEQDIGAEKTPRGKNEVILKNFEVSRDGFGMLREILRRVDHEDIAAKLDLVGPDPATDADCLKARQTLKEAS